MSEASPEEWCIVSVKKCGADGAVVVHEARAGQYVQRRSQHNCLRASRSAIPAIPCEMPALPSHRLPSPVWARTGNRPLLMGARGGVQHWWTRTMPRQMEPAGNQLVQGGRLQ